MKRILRDITIGMFVKAMCHCVVIATFMTFFCIIRIPAIYAAKGCDVEYYDVRKNLYWMQDRRWTGIAYYVRPAAPPATWLTPGVASKLQLRELPFQPELNRGAVLTGPPVIGRTYVGLPFVFSYYDWSVSPTFPIAHAHKLEYEPGRVIVVPVGIELWWGFLNVVTLYCCCFIGILAVRSARRAVRHARSLCTHCGYPNAAIRGLRCSECGEVP